MFPALWKPLRAALLLLVGVPLHAQTGIVAIPFDTVPPGTTFVGPTIGLQGDTAVTGGLSTTGNYLWSTPRTYYATIPGSAFLETNNTDSLGTNKYWFKVHNYLCFYNSAVLPNQLDFVARIDLPHGSSIQSITLDAYDNAAGADATFTLFAYRRLLTSTAVEGIMSGGGGFGLTTAGSSTEIQTASQVPLGTRGIIDNQSYAYEMLLAYALPTAASNDIRFYGAQIAYTLDGPAN